MQSHYKVQLFLHGTMFPILVYKEPNDSKELYGLTEDYYTKLVNRYSLGEEYQLSSIHYKVSTPFIHKIESVANERGWWWNDYRVGDNARKANFNSVYPNGDCFMSRVSFRQSYNGKIYDVFLDEDDVPIENNSKPHYNHGRLFSIVLQSDVNTGLRGQDKLGFYPIWASNWNSPINAETETATLCARFGGDNGINGEDFIYDWGHSQTLPMLSIPGLDDIYKDRSIHYMTRVRWTDRFFEGSFDDAWRRMFYGSKVDISAEIGEIMGVASYVSSLIIATLDNVCQLHPEQKALGNLDANDSTNVILGTGPILSTDYKKLSDFGTQHKSIIQNDSGIYGFDFKRDIFWKTNSRAISSGTVISCNPISNDISAFIKRRKKFLPDDVKLRMGYDEGEKEVYMSIVSRELYNLSWIIEGNQMAIQLAFFGDISLSNVDLNGYIVLVIDGEERIITVNDIYNNIVYINTPIEYDKYENGSSGNINGYLNCGYTLNYSERLSNNEEGIEFITRVGISPDVYMSLNNVLMSTDRLFDTNGSVVWSHDNVAEKARFYGRNAWFIYEIIVNNAREGKDFMQSIFGSFVVTSNNVPFSNVDFQTENQQCRHNPFIDNSKFWVIPEFSENKWSFTIPEADNTVNEYDIDSNMRGTWLRARFVYKGIANKYIGEIINKNVLSFN
jgi:hypothetical protein